MSPREVSHFHAIHRRVLETQPPEAEPAPVPPSIGERIAVMIPIVIVVALCTLVACVAIVPPIAP